MVATVKSAVSPIVTARIWIFNLRSTESPPLTLRKHKQSYSPGKCRCRSRNLSPNKSDDCPFPRLNPGKGEAESHQDNFSANWICREVVVVVVIWPADGFRAPVPLPSIISLWATGGERLTRLVQLKHSIRNCTSEDSEIFLRGMVLNKEKSNAISPGPMSVLRPALPYWVLGFGGVKHSSLMYCWAFPGFTRVVQRGPKTLLGRCS